MIRGMMMKYKALLMSGLNNERGMAFVMALLCMLLMVSLGVLVFSITMKDQITSIKLAGEAKATSAAEHGIAQMLINFNPGTTNASSSEDTSAWGVVNADTSPDGRFYYSIPSDFTPCPPASGTNLGNDIGRCYLVDVRGANTNFVAQQRLSVGVRTTTRGSLTSTEY
jgi:Tfp pilus assembly protein PilX